MSAAQISINLLPGVPSSDIMDIVEAYDFPSGYQVQWTDLSFHEKRNRGRIGPLMALAVLFAYLFLVAQYESWAIPVPVMLTVATATLGAFIGLHIAGQTLSIYAQLGLVMLIGLTAKNAILMVEFSKQERDKGRTIFQAALDGANLRFRAVQMTAWSFLFGVFPLVVATGAGAGSRVAIGVPTFSGMLVATFIGIILTPALYATFQRFREWVKHRFHMKTAAEKYAEEHGTEIDG
jgi:multidrug efflux pump subunit AcrB